MLEGRAGTATYFENNRAVRKNLVYKYGDHPKGGPLCYVFVEEAEEKYWYFSVAPIDKATDYYAIYWADNTYHDFAYAKVAPLA